MAKVVVSQLTKTFGAVTAVANMDLLIDDGAFVFLLGPSGCGKTTTLRMIAGLEMPTSGRIEIDGRNVTYLRPRYRNVGMVFQDYGLYRHMTVFGNISYPLKVRRLGYAAIVDKVQAVARMLQISDVLERRPDQLAGGQLQRVAIARMLVRDAAVFLMDEPMSHLDAQLRGHMRTELKHLQKKIGVTTIFVTHDQLEAMTMADQIIVMKDARIQQCASPQDVFERPVNEFVATFVGEPQMNILDVTIEPHQGGLAAAAAGFLVPLDRAWIEDRGAALAARRPLRLGARPEHLSVRPAADSRHTIPATIYAYEGMGAEAVLVLKCQDQLISVLAPMTEVGSYQFKDGASCFLGFDPAWLYLFDPKDGKALAHAAALDRSEDRFSGMRISRS